MPPCFGIQRAQFTPPAVIWIDSEQEVWLFLLSPLPFFSTSQMAELLYYMEKLRGLMKKYHHIVQRYHVQYLAQFDALVLNDTIQVAAHAK